MLKQSFSEFLTNHLVMDFIPKWEDWVDLNTNNIYERELHYSLIRLFKGQVKAWRRFNLRIKQ
jgi:hypothetical protein